MSLQARLRPTLLTVNAENLNSFYKKRKKKVINRYEIFGKVTSTKFQFIHSDSISSMLGSLPFCLSFFLSLLF